MQRSDRRNIDPNPRPKKINHTQFDRRRSPDYPGKSNVQTQRKIPESSLSIAPTEVVHVLRELGQAVKWLGKMKSPEDQRERNKLYEFYNDHGYKTNECIALRLEVADLLKCGLLSDLLTNKEKETWS